MGTGYFCVKKGEKMKKKTVIATILLIIFCVLLFTFIYNKFTQENKINVAISTFTAKFSVDEKTNENVSEKTIETENEPISNIEIEFWI